LQAHFCAIVISKALASCHHRKDLTTIYITVTFYGLSQLFLNFEYCQNIAYFFLSRPTISTNVNYSIPISPPHGTITATATMAVMLARRQHTYTHTREREKGGGGAAECVSCCYYSGLTFLLKWRSQLEIGTL
jgi:hypothetical protein